MAKIVAIVNQKGGVGKTTTCVNLTAALKLSGKRVLMCDFDPQANATSGLGIEKRKIKKSIYDVVLGGVSAAEAIISTPYGDVLPSSADLAGAAVELIGVENRERALKNALDQVKENVAIADRCSVGGLTENEKACIDDIRAFLNSVPTIPCTGCRYCVAGCPMQIQIPVAFSCYNGAVKFGNKEAQMRSYNRDCSNLADCVECRQCAEACPQHLDIPELLKEVRAYFEG